MYGGVRLGRKTGGFTGIKRFHRKSEVIMYLNGEKGSHGDMMVSLESFSLFKCYLYSSYKVVLLS